MKKYKKLFAWILITVMILGVGVSPETMFVLASESPETPLYHMIPSEHLTATAGNEETREDVIAKGEGSASFAIDGDKNTLWHTQYGGWNVDEDHWIQLEIDGYYDVMGLMYLPRKTTGLVPNSYSNGTITSYQILVSDDGEQWTEVAVGNWPVENGWKTVTFDKVSAKYVRVRSVESEYDRYDYNKERRLSTAAELRLLVPSTQGIEIPKTEEERMEDLLKQSIPLAYLTATAGSEELNFGEEGPAALAIDGDIDTIWHTEWYNNRYIPDEDQWIQLEISKECEVTGLMYLPRKTAGALDNGYSNGTISAYQILVSNDGENWVEVANGTWPIEAGWKVAAFDAVSTKYVRLMSVESFSGVSADRISSGAEIRLLTGSVDDFITPEPTIEPTVTETPTPTVVPTITEQPITTEIPEATPTVQPKDFQVQKIFKDVYKDWYTEYVQYVYDKGLMTGMKGTRLFKPMGNVTKAQVVQVLYNMEGKPEVIDRKVFDELKDVYREEWYADAVAWSYNNGVITGDLNAKKFFPNQDVTREQLALMLYRYAQCRDYDTSQTSDLSGLLNVHKVANWSEDGVRWAVGTGIISGVQIEGDRDLMPQGTASRAQMAAIFTRFCQGYNIQFPNNKPGIPSDAMKWQGHYYAVIDNCHSWEEAAEYCEALGGHLATITSKAEDLAIYTYMKEKGYTSAYFGLSDTETEGTWKWVTGESTEYLNWNELEPGGGSAENYGMYFYIYEDGTWNDGAFKENVYDGGNAYICEWEN